jgi:O-antigen ligase
VFVCPIPHTIGLRNLLLLFGVGVLLWTCRGLLPRSAVWLKPTALSLSLLTAWILFHSVAIAPSLAAALDQFRANWVMPLLLGAIAAWAAAQLPQERSAQAITIALAAHMVWLLGGQLKLWLVTGFWPFKATPFGAYDYHGTLNSFLLALVVADRLAWVLQRRSPLALGARAGWGLLLLTLVADVSLQSRNSTLVSLAILLAAGLLLLAVRSNDKRALVAVSFVVLVGAGSLSFDSRWQGLRESAAVGWSATSTYWMTSDIATRPGTPSGATLEESAYARSAWASQAVSFIAEHPLGIGFGHDAFGRAVAMKYGHAGMGSSHSGWLDFALGTGLVGLALLLATAGLAIRGGWREFRERNDAQALLLAFFVGAYTLRCLLDGHLSGWRLGLFAFIVGVMIAGMKNPRTDS